MISRFAVSADYGTIATLDQPGRQQRPDRPADRDPRLPSRRPVRTGDRASLRRFRAVQRQILDSVSLGVAAHCRPPGARSLCAPGDAQNAQCPRPDAQRQAISPYVQQVCNKSSKLTDTKGHASAAPFCRVENTCEATLIREISYRALVLLRVEIDEESSSSVSTSLRNSRASGGIPLISPHGSASAATRCA